MHLSKVLTAVMLTMLIAEANAWRRRRRRSCATNGCTWKWGDCSRTCGGGQSSPIITTERGSCGPACHLPAPRACNVEYCRADIDECEFIVNHSLKLNDSRTYIDIPVHGGDRDNYELYKVQRCHEKANCSDIPGSYICECVNGYSGDGFLCQDVDECLAMFGRENNHTSENPVPTYVNATSLYAYKSCGSNSTCTNMDGSYECDCLSGFVGDGYYCDDIDECEFIVNHSLKFNDSRTYIDIPVYGGDSDNYELYRVQRCHEKANCSNIPGSYICECMNGYSGDGFLCQEPSKLKSPATDIVTTVWISAVVILTLAVGVGAVLLKIRRCRSTAPGAHTNTFSQITDETKTYSTGDYEVVSY